MNAPAEIALYPNHDWAAPLFLLRPPLDPAIAWHFRAPSLEAPVCQMPTMAQIASPVFERYRSFLRIRPVPHRRNWEPVWILAMARAAKLLEPGLAAIGFGVGQEPMPSVLARHGLSVLATDLPAEDPRAAAWIKGRQHCASLEAVLRSPVVEPADFDARVRFEPADIAAPPPALAGRFDLAWSVNVLGQLGSAAAAVDALEASLAVLRPGGVALHTFGLLIDDDDTPAEARQNTFLRRRDVEHLLSRLISAGHEPWPLNLYPGDEEGDAHLDPTAQGMPQLKARQGERVVTSLGLAVRRRAQ